MRRVSGLILMILKSYSLPGSSGPALFSGPVVGRKLDAPSSRRLRSSISVLWQSASMLSPNSTNAPNVAMRETLPFTICPTLCCLNQSPQMSLTCLMPSDTRRFSGSIFSTLAVTSSPFLNTSCGFLKGEDVTAKVLKIDPENRRVSLGIKQVNDIWGDWFKQHKVGQIVKGKVSRIATFGAFVELGENIEALCHNTEIEERKRRDEGPSSFRPTTGPLKSAGPLEPGKEYDFKIIKISPETRRIGLSYRAAVKQIERKEIEQYRSTSKSSSTATIGDALKSKLSAR